MLDLSRCSLAWDIASWPAVGYNQVTRRWQRVAVDSQELILDMAPYEAILRVHSLDSILKVGVHDRPRPALRHAASEYRGLCSTRLEATLWDRFEELWEYTHTWKLDPAGRPWWIPR